MRKVVFLAINSKHVHSSLAVWLLAAGVREYAGPDYKAEIIEATIHQPDAEIAARVAEQEPDVVGISTYIWNARKIPALLKLLRECTAGAVLVLGGPEASFNAPYWLGIGADYVLQGEGERSFPLLLDALAGYKSVSLDAVPGLWRNQGGIPVLSGAEEAPAGFIDPYSDAYFGALGGRIAYIETSRGCPFRCAFCLSGKSSLRFCPVEDAKKRLHALSRSGAGTIKLVDRTFNCDPGRAYELFEYVIGLDTACRFHFEVAADLFDDRTLRLLGASPPGRIQMEAGLQSFHQPALTAVNRRTDLHKVERNILKLLKAGNIHIHLDLIAGLPLETLGIFKDSFDRAYALGAHNLQLGFLKLLHGSALRETAGDSGIVYSPEPPYEIICSPWLSRDDLQLLKQTENALSRTHNKGRFLLSLKYALDATKFRPFDLYRGIGEAVRGYGESLGAYSQELYVYLAGLPGVDSGILRDHMVCDWLGFNRGKNLPACLQIPDRRRKRAAEIAEGFLGYRPERSESMVLTSGGGRAVFVDGRTPDPVTGLYRLRFVDL